MQFSSAIARLYLSLPRSRTEVEALGRKLLQSSTSIVAHVREASYSRSDAELCSKLEGAIQEADESMLCLEMLQDDFAINELSLAQLQEEVNEIIASFASMVTRIKMRTLKF
ncbi:MAG TPA: four helix bundle protein [Terrimicrobiaceae bacterium]